MCVRYLFTITESTDESFTSAWVRNQSTSLKKAVEFLHEDKEFLIAAEVGNSALLQDLISDDADIQQMDHLGRNALHLAVCADNEHAIIVLLNAGILPNVKDNLGMTPLSLCLMRRPSLKVANLLFDHGAEILPRSNAMDTGLFLLIQRVDGLPNAKRCRCSWTPIISEELRERCQRWIVDKTGQWKETREVLSYARPYKSSKSYNKDVVLYHMGLSDWVYREKKFVMMCTPTLEEAKILQLLTTKGALINDPEAPGGRQALHFAAMSDNCLLIQVLIDLGADLYLVNHRNETPREVALTFKCKNAYAFLHRVERLTEPSSSQMDEHDFKLFSL